MVRMFAIIWKDTRLRFSGWAEWLFFLILPIVFTLVLAGGTGGSGDSRIRLVVVNQAGSALSAQLIAALNESEAVRPEVLPLERAEREFEQRRVSAVLILPPELDLDHLQQGQIALELRQQPNNLNALAAAQAAQAIVARIGSAVEIASASVAAAERLRPFDSGSARQAYFQAALQEAQAQWCSSPSGCGVSATSEPARPVRVLAQACNAGSRLLPLDTEITSPPSVRNDRHGASCAPFGGSQWPWRKLLRRLAAVRQDGSPYLFAILTNRPSWCIIGLSLCDCRTKPRSNQEDAPIRENPL